MWHEVLVGILETVDPGLSRLRHNMRRDMPLPVTGEGEFVIPRSTAMPAEIWVKRLLATSLNLSGCCWQKGRPTCLVGVCSKYLMQCEPAASGHGLRRIIDFVTTCGFRICGSTLLPVPPESFGDFVCTSVLCPYGTARDFVSRVAGVNPANLAGQGPLTTG